LGGFIPDYVWGWRLFASRQELTDRLECRIDDFGACHRGDETTRNVGDLIDDCSSILHFSDTWCAFAI
jgi:hypothetical protein